VLTHFAGNAKIQKDTDTETRDVHHRKSTQLFQLQYSQPQVDSRAVTPPPVIAVLCSVLRGDAVDWPATSNGAFYDELLSESIQQGVDALIAYQLKPTVAWQNLPGFFKDELDRRLSNAVAKEMVRSRDVVALQHLMEKEGITFLIIKGGALSYTHYPKPYLRSRVDTDVFIAPGDIGPLREALIRHGYRLQGWVYKSHQFNALRVGFGGEVVKYDVHWRSNNRSKYARVISFEEAFQQAVRIPGLSSCLTLSPVHSLLQACLHRAGSTYHDPNRLIWLFDIHLLVSRMTGNEQLEFAGETVRKDVQNICLDAVQKSEQLFQTGMSHQAQELLGTEAGRDSGDGRFSNSQLALIIDDFRQLPDLSSRLGMVREFLFPPGNYLLSRYQKTGWYWVPFLYLRYFLAGAYSRITLH